MRDVIEWDETELSRYSKRYIHLDNMDWLDEFTINRNKRFYLTNESPSEIIINSIKKVLNGNKK